MVCAKVYLFEGRFWALAEKRKPSYRNKTGLPSAYRNPRIQGCGYGYHQGIDADSEVNAGELLSFKGTVQIGYMERINTSYSPCLSLALGINSDEYP